LFTSVINCRLLGRHWSSPERQADAKVGDGHDEQRDEVDGSEQKDLVCGLLFVRPARLAGRQQIAVDACRQVAVSVQDHQLGHHEHG